MRFPAGGEKMKPQPGVISLITLAVTTAHNFKLRCALPRTAPFRLWPDSNLKMSSAECCCDEKKNHVPECMPTNIDLQEEKHAAFAAAAAGDSKYNAEEEGTSSSSPAALAQRGRQAKRLKQALKSSIELLGFLNPDVRVFRVADAADEEKLKKILPGFDFVPINSAQGAANFGQLLNQDHSGVERTNERHIFSEVYVLKRLLRGHKQLAEALKKISPKEFVTWLYENGMGSKSIHVDTMFALWKLMIRVPEYAEMEHSITVEVPSTMDATGAEIGNFVAHIIMKGAYLYFARKEDLNSLRHGVEAPTGGSVISVMLSFDGSPVKAVQLLQDAFAAGTGVGLHTLWAALPAFESIPKQSIEFRGGWSHGQSVAGGYGSAHEVRLRKGTPIEMIEETSKKKSAAGAFDFCISHLYTVTGSDLPLASPELSTSPVFLNRTILTCEHAFY